jgi:transcriptional regulator with XRE-family HTH domain
MSARDEHCEVPQVSTPNRKASQHIRYRLADNVARLRRARGYTQKELAEQCDMSPSYIGDVEQGNVNITLANLEALAAGLNCSEADLLWSGYASRIVEQTGAGNCG